MKKISLFLISLSLLIVFNNTFRWYQNSENNVFQFGDWLMNYQGGFVRRGFFGEIFFRIYEITNISPPLILFIFLIFLYLFFGIYFFKLLKKVQFNHLIIFSLFSPLAFFFPVFNSVASAKKEILFFLTLTLVCYFLPKINKKYYSYIFFISCSLLTLTHEGYLFYFAYLFIPFFLLLNPRKFYEIKNFSALTFVLITFLSLLMYNFMGTEEKIFAICNSIKEFVYATCGSYGPIHARNIDSYLSENWVKDLVYIRSYSLYFLLGFLPLSILHLNSTLEVSIFQKKFNSFILLILPFIITLPIYYLALDWGRWLNISYMSSLIIFIFLINNNFIKLKNYKSFSNNIYLKRVLISLVFVIYCFGWTVPICCNPEIKGGLYRTVKLGISSYERHGFELPEYFFK